jgi:hypothetical protein
VRSSCTAPPISRLPGCASSAKSCSTKAYCYQDCMKYCSYARSPVAQYSKPAHIAVAIQLVVPHRGALQYTLSGAGAHTAVCIECPCCLLTICYLTDIAASFASAGWHTSQRRPVTPFIGWSPAHRPSPASHQLRWLQPALRSRRRSIRACAIRVWQGGVTHVHAP